MAGAGFNLFSLDPPSFLRTIKQRLYEIETELARPILEGAAKSYDDYRHRVGQLQGVRLAVSIVEQLERGDEQSKGKTNAR